MSVLTPASEIAVVRVIHSDEHATEATPHGSKCFGRDGNHASTFGIAPRNFDILETEEGKATGGEKHKERRGVLNVTIKDAWDLVD